jgi:hypothetical protein
MIEKKFGSASSAFPPVTSGRILDSCASSILASVSTSIAGAEIALLDEVLDLGLAESRPAAEVGN